MNYKITEKEIRECGAQICEKIFHITCKIN